MVFTHHVNVAHAFRRAGLFDAGQAGKVFGGDENLAFPEEHFRQFIGDQHPVIGAYQHVTIRHAGTERIAPDQDRAEMRRGHQTGGIERPAAGPADFAKAVVPGDDAIAGAQILDHLDAARRGDAVPGVKHITRSISEKWAVCVTPPDPSRKSTVPDSAPVWVTEVDSPDRSSTSISESSLSS